MSAQSPSPAFEHAAKYLSRASSLSSVSNTIKLELYGLFKYLTVSHTPSTSRPSIFDFAGRAKWDAWSTAGQTYGDRVVDAESRYLELARELGWSEDSVVENKPEDEGDIWDSDSDTADRPTTGGGGGGMGNSVSRMITSDGEESKSIMNRLVVSGDTEGMVSFLDNNPDADINEVDENGYTPLHLACDRGNPAMVELLLSRGADRSIKDADDLTALELAEISDHKSIVDILKAPS